jgi:glycosyltransferase involved in cell wall biosynthesis
MEVRAFGTVRRPMTWPPCIDYRRRLSDIALAQDVYNQSAIFVSSSILEGFGFPMAEGMACGCAIACTDSGGVRDFAEHRATALLSPPRDVDGLVKHILQLVEDRELRIRLARAGQARIAEFTWERSSDLLEARLGELVQSRRDG